MKLHLVAAGVLYLGLFVTSAFADNVSGVFKAVSACDAYKSFRHGTNPGLVHTVPGAEYEAVEVNSKEMDWVRIKIPNISDPLRWVAGSCGTKDFGRPVSPEEEIPVTGKKDCHTKNKFDSYVLAMSWQPGFCEHVSYRGVKPECDALRKGELVVDHLTLHGLWPNRKACGTKYDNCGGPRLDLEEATVSQVSPWMPNFYYETAFGTHEWDTHGTCQTLADDQYFLKAIKLVQAVDDSGVGSYIKSRVGSTMSIRDFYTQIAAQHGQDVADKVNLLCADGQYLQEIRINLPAVIPESADLRQLTAGAPVSSDKKASTCNSDSIYVERSGVGTSRMPSVYRPMTGVRGDCPL